VYKRQLFKESFVDFVKGSRQDIFDEINDSKDLSEPVKEEIVKLVDTFKNMFFKDQGYSLEEIELAE
jgi:F0F1-type ATP synthase alpha subunit